MPAKHSVVVLKNAREILACFVNKCLQRAVLSLPVTLRLEDATKPNSEKMLRYNNRFLHTHARRPCGQFHETPLQIRLKSCSSKDRNSLTSSSILLEDNLSFQEVPLLVKTTNDLHMNVDGEKPIERGNNNVKIEPENAFLESDAIAKVVEIHIVNSTNLAEVMRYLKLVPTNTVSPSLALNILRRVTSLLQDESDNKSGNSAKSSPHTLDESDVTYTLCQLISRSENHGDVLAGLTAMSSFLLQEDEKKRYLDIFVTECFHRISEGKFSLLQICEVIEALQKAGPEYACLCDNLWSEVVERVSEVSEENIHRVFNLILYMKAPRKVIFRALESRAMNLMPRLNETSIAGILSVVHASKVQSLRLLKMSSAWLNLNIHQVSEDGLQDYLTQVQCLNYIDERIQKSVEKYVRLKGGRCSNSSLMATVANYLTKFRWLNKTCLEGIAEFFLRNYDNVPSYDILSFIEMFSFLNYEPKNAFEVFEALETVLKGRFSEIEPDNVIVMMLACVQMQRYPLNFVSRIFRPLFLDRMTYMISGNEQRLKHAHNNLRLLDIALSLECPLYAGPYMPRDYSCKSLSRDARLYHLCNRLSRQLEDLLGGRDKFDICVVVPKLPLSHLYILDFALFTDKNGQPLPYSSVAGIDKNIAVLVLLPEHLCHEENHVVGPQAMRIRHLQILGYQVVCLEYNVLDKFSNSQKELLLYLRESLSQAITIPNTNDV